MDAVLGRVEDVDEDTEIENEARLPAVSEGDAVNCEAIQPIAGTEVLGDRKATSSTNFQ